MDLSQHGGQPITHVTDANRGSPQHEQRVRFAFAVTLAHELTHAIRSLHNGMMDRALGVGHEPYYALGDEYQELDCSLKGEVLGFQLDEIVPGHLQDSQAENHWRVWISYYKSGWSR